MAKSADIILNIESGVKYIPLEHESAIYMIHCTKTNECEVKIKTFYDGLWITFPPGSFVKGAIYPIVVLEMEFDSNLAAFVGYKLLSSNGSPKFLPKGWLTEYQRKNITN